MKAPYGPYAENLRHVLSAVEAHLISGYSGAEAPSEQLALVPGAVKDATPFLETRSVTHERFNRVVRLVEGFETSFGLELLATVHWVVKEEGASGMEEIERATHQWSARKQQFTTAQIRLAAERLRLEGWLDSSAGV